MESIQLKDEVWFKIYSPEGEYIRTISNVSIGVKSDAITGEYTLHEVDGDWYAYMWAESLQEAVNKAARLRGRSFVEYEQWKYAPRTLGIRLLKSERWYPDGKVLKKAYGCGSVWTSLRNAERYRQWGIENNQEHPMEESYRDSAEGFEEEWRKWGF